jgi:Signal transduction histidine kinase regulating C4-dicarboxylate transport system
MQKSLMDLQLMDAVQLTGVYWAVWLERSKSWELLAAYKINLKQRKEILQQLAKPEVNSWLVLALSGKNILSRRFPKNTILAGQKLYIFPNQVSQRVILVGGGNISGAARRFWQVVADGQLGNSLFDQKTFPMSFETEMVSYHLPRALDRIMEIIMKAADSNGGWLAVRSGDQLVIKAQANDSKYLDRQLAIAQNPLLQEIIQNRKTRVVTKNDSMWKSVPRLDFNSSTKVWVALPLVIGTRVIGLVAVWRSEGFPQDNIRKLQVLLERIASPIEGSITFTELTGHLHRLAYLNDFAVTVFASVNMDQIVQRTFALLQRAFNTSRIFLELWVRDGSSKLYFYGQDRMIRLKTVSTPIIPPRVEKGHVYKNDYIASDPSYKVTYKGSKSALVTPIKFQKKVIGLLGLESEQEGGFTINDEHLIAVIASYIAGFFENNQLREEAETKARNLKLIHEVVERVIGQKDVRQLAQAAAELMADNFKYELVVVALVRGPKKELQVAGIGGKISEEAQNNLKSMNALRKNSVAILVAETGKSVLVKDGRFESIDLSGKEWKGKSGMCVALKEGEQSFGIIEVKSKVKYAFSQNDLTVLETLGGILASVISNVGQYQKLQMTVKQLRATQEELQEHIAAQQMAERRLVQAAKLAAVGEMAAGIAHELNNPLTTVTGFTELTMEDVPVESRVHADLELVLREAHRATDVVRRLLDFARQSESVRTHSDLNEIVNEVLALVNHLLHSNGVNLVTDLPGGLPTISVDRNQIKQVILNLIHNALHAMPKGGELRITTHRRSRDHQDWVTVVISDSGIGIAPENMERIFEPFFTTRSKEGGTGLGLSISYSIVADHGGFIEAESQVGNGSIFSIWIPVEVN